MSARRDKLGYKKAGDVTALASIVIFDGEIPHRYK